MAATLIQLDPKQKARLKRRAKLHGHSVSQEVQYAIDLYLVLSPDVDKELAALARSANETANHNVKRLDETIAFVSRILKKMNARRARSQQSGT
jgi:ABC-type transporter Mla subunit MlaD